MGQQQIQAQLMQQGVLVESMRQLPEFRDMADLAGDIPLDGVDSEDESQPSTLTRRREPDEYSNSTLGTSAKVCVEFGVEPHAPDFRKDDFSSLPEWEELMKRGGINGEDTGEPSIQSPKSSALCDP